MFHTFFYCFYCWLWKDSCLLGYCFSIKLLKQFWDFLICFSNASASNLSKTPLKPFYFGILATINECIKEQNTYLSSLLVHQRCLGSFRNFYRILTYCLVHWRYSDAIISSHQEAFYGIVLLEISENFLENIRGRVLFH